MAPNIILLNKPYEVLSQFTDKDGRRTLAECIPSKFKDYYPAGRLDYDSEGLLLLTNNGKVQQHIAHPKFKLSKTYWVQVEGDIDSNALNTLCQGVSLKDGPARATKAKRLDISDAPWPRQPPIRQRKTIATSWLSLNISEGRNRQVRRMTAAVGFPTLRLIRYAIGHWTVDALAPGEYQTDTINLPKRR